ncbi:phosphopantetheine-binding protein [Phytohabitans sp. LJ34]|jgi:acyl carrier protein|uniref:phosphopantetheine-binding protein n=1 Tax=Phytohabitans sp. LJ34 TaxID=3452217 RepID=UPI003F8A3994
MEQLDTDLRPRVVDSIRMLLPRVLRKEMPEPTEQSRLMEDLGMSSSSTLELMLELEEDLALQIDVEDIDRDDFATVGTLADFVVRHLIPEE